MDKTVIKVEHLSKLYKIFDKPSDRVKESLYPFRKRFSRDFYALNDVCFEVRRGECIGLLGKNGAGKSTLLKLLTGVLTPSSGKVEIDGKISALLELGGSFNPEMTGMQNIFFNGTLMGYTKKEIKEKLPTILEFADIGDFINQPVKMYSSGMFARLAFAVSVNVEPDILIVDEVLAVGDLRFQMKCMDKMKKLMSGGTTVLFVSHDINAVRRLCNRAIWIDNGNLILDADVNTVGDRYVEYIRSNVSNVNKDNDDNLKKVNKALDTNVAEIIGFYITDSLGNKIDVIDYNKIVNIEVEYVVNNEDIENPVLGIALFDYNDKYICGLNTFLDNIGIPWKKGLNKFRIKYDEGLMVLGGRYYFDVALEDKTATVPIHYIKCVKSINVKSEYVSEGVFTIPHTWGK